MGSTQSQEKPDVVRIERSEIPEEYKTVGVSSDVVRRVNAQNPDTGSEKLKAELAKEKDEKNRLRDEMARLTVIQQKLANGNDVSALSANLASDLENRKKIFEETVDRVEKQFFSLQRENACEQNEKEIAACLQNNPGRILKCSSLVQQYEECAEKFRQQVLQGN
ncbi:unnamed protein product [Auanema sp. JU1783]|nr:unnamed protein product [Auanema sp. JU1783]